MAGKKVSQDILNYTLEFILKLLNENNIQNWFISYGTLLGIIRDNSCINGDDDIDIIIDSKHREQLKNLLSDNKFSFRLFKKKIFRKKDKRNIIKTKPTAKYASVDFYIVSVDDEGNFNDKWNGVVWSNCYDKDNKLIEYIWNENKLYIPFNYETKLINRYGNNWRIPQNSKGPKPVKRII